MLLPPLFSPSQLSVGSSRRRGGLGGEKWGAAPAALEGETLAVPGGGHRASANLLFSSLLTRHRSETGHDQEKPNPDGFCLGTRTGPCRTGSGGMWLLGGVGGGGLRARQALVTSTAGSSVTTPVTPAGALLGFGWAGALFLLLYPLGGCWGVPWLGGHRAEGWLSPGATKSWGCRDMSPGGRDGGPAGQHTRKKAGR